MRGQTWSARNEAMARPRTGPAVLDCVVCGQDWINNAMSLPRARRAWWCSVGAVMMLACGCSGAHTQPTFRRPSPPAPSGHCPSGANRVVKLTDIPSPPPVRVVVGAVFEAVSKAGSYPTSKSTTIVPLCVLQKGTTFTTYFRADAPGRAVITSATAGCGPCAQRNLSANIVVSPMVSPTA